MAAGEVSVNIQDHGRALNEPNYDRKRVECKYCNKVMSGFYRLKYHLGGVPGGYISYCSKVPQNVKDSFRSIVEKGRASRGEEGTLSKEPSEEVSVSIEDHSVTVGGPNCRRFQCNYCGKLMSKVIRLKYHLGGIPGGQVTLCPNVPLNVKESFRKSIEEAERATRPEELAVEDSVDIDDHGVTLVGPKYRVQCKYCDKVMSKLIRFKYHLGGIPGGGVTFCPKVPQNVKKSVRSIVETEKAIHPEKRRCLNVISQTSDTESENSTDTDSDSGDWLMEPAEVPKKRVVSRIAVNADQDKDSPSRFFYETGIDYSGVKEMQDHGCSKHGKQLAVEDSVDIHDHGVTLVGQKYRVQCKYCDKVMSKFIRLKYHLGGIPGGGVTFCPKVPQNVKKSVRSILETGKATHPQKRRCLNEVKEISDSQSGSSTDSDSGSEDWLMELSEVPKKRAVSQIALNADQDKDSTSRFFYETGIDYTEVKEMQEYVKIIRQSWKRTGCSILLDGWTDEKGRELVSFIVECPQGPVYLHSSDVSTIVDNVDALQLLLDGVIKDVGVQNVVQIVAFSSTGWVGALGKQFMERYKSIFWTVDASHCLELILDKIATMNDIKATLEKGKVISEFLHSHPTLSKPSRSNSATPFLILDSLVSKKESLSAVCASSKWKTSVLASGMEGKRVANLVADSSFWKRAEMVTKVTSPLVKVLHMINTNDKQQMGHFYEAMVQAKETIKDQFWEAISEIWNGHLHSPLHAAGYYLNPSRFYSDDFHNDPVVAFGMLCCIVRLAPDKRIQDLISKQLETYKNAEGAFSEGSSYEQIDKFSPATWWFVYGEEYPELQRFATRILSQTCTGASKYTLKRSLAEMVLTNGIRNRNPVEQEALSDVAFLHYNLQLQEQHLQQVKLGSYQDV